MVNGLEGYELWGHMYDGLLCQVHSYKVDTMVHHIKNFIEHPITCLDVRGHRRTFTIPCAVQVGPTWGDLEDWND